MWTCMLRFGSEPQALLACELWNEGKRESGLEAGIVLGAAVAGPS